MGYVLRDLLAIRNFLPMNLFGLNAEASKKKVGEVIDLLSITIPFIKEAINCSNIQANPIQLFYKGRNQIFLKLIGSLGSPCACNLTGAAPCAL